MRQKYRSYKKEEQSCQEDATRAQACRSHQLPKKNIDQKEKKVVYAALDS